jgi:hypothetical protein
MPVKSFRALCYTASVTLYQIRSTITLTLLKEKSLEPEYISTGDERVAQFQELINLLDGVGSNVL